jgi:hypothetical protein
MTRLATGYAKRFWKQGRRYLGETLYLDGRILVHHSLEELTIDRPTDDLDPGNTSSCAIPTNLREHFLRRDEGGQ